MKKVALIFVIAVFVPSLVLAWLAVRSLRDQQFLLERQQSLLYQGAADSTAASIQNALGEHQRDFVQRVEGLLSSSNTSELGKNFDDQLRKDWPLAQVGFVVTLSGDILSPSPYSRAEARLFCADNSRFLANREAVEVYWNPKQAYNNLAANTAAQQLANQSDSSVSESDKKNALIKGQQARSVSPQQQVSSILNNKAQVDEQQYSKVAASEAEFRQLIGDSSDGALARFVDNKLKVLFWYRPPREPQLVFGAQLALPRLLEGLRTVIQQAEPALREEICVALLDDAARPVAVSQMGFQTNWKRPFVATEIGETLPHWEVALYLLNPAKLTQAARTAKLTLGLLILVLVLAIGVGSWLIVADLKLQLRLARQKTDFVSNVSHELKTPLTSIRMFSELLADGRVTDPVRQRSYLHIITAETARLTRLINNVLDFSRMEQGQKKYNFQDCDLARLVAETTETYRPHLENSGFALECKRPEAGVLVRGDADALSQIVVNLLSNAEKYSNGQKEICIEVKRRDDGPLPFAEVKVLDRGSGVPRGSEEKIFEKFYRAHDSLSSGIQGSGLGLTLARQIARAHGGDVIYETREGGGSCFSLRLPVICSGGE